MSSGQSTSGSSSQQGTSIPIITNPTVKSLVESSASGVQAEQNAMPLSQFNAANPQQTAPMSTLQNYGASLVPLLNDTPEAEALALQYAKEAPGLAGTVASGAGIENDPAIKAQVANYYANTVPQLQNYYATAGLGRSSSLGNAEALGLSSMLPSLYESQLAREQGAIESQASTMAGLVSSLTGMGAQDTTRLKTAIDEAEAVGGTQQQTEQAGYTAEYQDYLRRQALAEEALYTPFNDLVAAGSIGQVSDSSGTQEGTTSGGLFK